MVLFLVCLQRMAFVAVIVGCLILQGTATAAVSPTIDIASDITVHMNDVVSVPFVLHVLHDSPVVLIPHSNSDIARSSLDVLVQNETSLNGVLNVTGVFLGTTKLSFTLTESKVSYWQMSN